jgi:hypothetical protein
MKRAKNKDMRMRNEEESEDQQRFAYMYFQQRTAGTPFAATGRKNRYILFSMHFPLCFKYDLGI